MALLLAALALFATPLVADGVFVNPDEEKVIDDPKAKLPIPEEGTAEEKELFKAAIEEARQNDVSVTPPAAMMYKGLMCTQDEDYEAAIPYLEEAIRMDPSQQAAWEGLGWSYIKTGEEERAFRLWSHFQRLMPEQALPYSLLAQAYILQQDWKHADENFRKYLEINPGNYDVRYWHAQNLMRLGKTEDAERIFRRLIKEDADRLDVQLSLASLLTHHLQFDEAVDIYRHVNQEIGDNPKYMLEQAYLELYVGELRTADQLCLDVLAIDPGNTQAMRLRADIVEIAGLNDIEPLMQIIDETSDPVTRAGLEIRLANRCQLANNRNPGSFPTAFILTLIHDAIEDDPGNAEYKVLYGERLIEAHRYEECRKWAESVLTDFNRHNSRAKQILFELALRENRYEDALQILTDLYSNFDSSSPMYNYNKARLYSAQGLYTEALKEIDKMEAAAEECTVFTLSYDDLTESDWSPVTSVRRLHEHILALQREGWELISPADLPKMLTPPPGERRKDPEPGVSVPITARLFDYVRYALTGERRFKDKKKGDLSSIPKPKKYFCVTFDEAKRSSLVLGTPVAAEFGVPFGIFASTKPRKEYVPSLAGWDELREGAKSGLWVVGTKLYDSVTKQPTEAEGINLRNPLPNRLWLEKKNRLESMNEWDRRMRNEFVLSREEAKKNLGEVDSPVAMVSYPYSDVGQLEGCNLSLVVKNPMSSILAEAARSYQLGFVQAESGFTVYGDNLLLSRRYMPSWTDEAPDVLRHAYRNHPVFLARRFRVDIAMLMNRPNLANQMLDVLRRDGYPEDLCRQMQIEIQAHFRNRPLRDVKPLVETSVASAGDQPNVQHSANPGSSPGLSAPAEQEEEGPGVDMLFGDEEAKGRQSSITNMAIVAKVQEGSIDPLFYLSHPSVEARISNSKANDQIETTRYGGKVGLNLNKNTAFSAEYFKSELKQTVIPRWNAIIITNVPADKAKYKFKAEKTEWRARLTHRFSSGAIVYAFGGVAKWKDKTKGVNYSDINLQDELNTWKFYHQEEDDILLLGAGAMWSPFDNLSLMAFYDRDYVSSAVKPIYYDSIGAIANWKPQDSWLVDVRGQYWSYEDDNAMFSLAGDSFWETSPDLGVWLGLQASVYNMSKPCDYYWSPFNEQRISGVLRFLQQWEGYSFRLDLLVGMSCAKGRGERIYKNEVITTEEVTHEDGTVTKTKGKGEGYYTMIDGPSDWRRCWGVSGSYEKALTSKLSLILTADVVSLRDYIDHSVSATLRLAF